MKKLLLILVIMVAFTGCIKEEVKNEKIIQADIENKTEEQVGALENKTEQKEREEPTTSIKPIENDEIKKEAQVKQMETEINKEETAKPKDDEIKKEETKTIASEGYEIGNKAIDFEVELLNDGKVKLSDYYGKPIFLNFWATWCGPCVREMPHIQEVSEEYGDKVVILAINISDSSEDVKAFVDNAKYTFNFGLNESGSLLTTYNSYSIPLSIFIDKDGIIKERRVGSMSKDTMVEIIEKIIQ